MKLTHPDLSIVFDTEIDQVNTLVIEEPLFLRSFLLDINRQIDGSSGQVVLSESEKPLEMCRQPSNTVTKDTIAGHGRT